VATQMTAPEFDTIRYEPVQNGVARIVLARPEVHNAQNSILLYELNDALDMACHDNNVVVIIVAADGDNFSSGHDLNPRGDRPMTSFKPVTPWGGFDLPGQEGHWAVEQEKFLGFSWRWRNIPKPTIVEVQGKVIAGGLMLVWPFDIIIASEDAKFADPTVEFGVNGVEYFGHPWEFGPRKAKELLFTGGAIDAQEAKSVGMVNKVVPRDQLESAAREMAEQIAKKPSMGLKLAKQAVNQAQDGQGFWSNQQAALSLHHLGHAHTRIDGIGVNPEIRKLIKDQMRDI